MNEHQLKIKKLFDKNELNRLERALKDKDKTKLTDWARQFEEQIADEFSRAYKQELDKAINNFIVTIVYTLHFNEKTKFGKERIKDFMDDLFSTIELYTTEEYKPEEYIEILRKDGIIVRKKGDEV
jgi:hypothetical protein